MLIAVSGWSMSVDELFMNSHQGEKLGRDVPHNDHISLLNQGHRPLHDHLRAVEPSVSPRACHPYRACGPWSNLCRNFG